MCCFFILRIPKRWQSYNFFMEIPNVFNKKDFFILFRVWLIPQKMGTSTTNDIVKVAE